MPRSTLRTALIAVLFMTVGLSLAPFIIGILMDVFTIVMFQVFGVHFGTGFVEQTLSIWPGGKVVGAIMFNHAYHPGALAVSLFEVLVVAALRALVPPIGVSTRGPVTVGSAVKGAVNIASGLGIPGATPVSTAMSFGLGARQLAGRYTRPRFTVKRLVGVSLLDAAITCLIAIGVSWMFTLGFRETFETLPAQIAAGVGSLLVIAVCVFVATRGTLGSPKFAFSMLLAVGRFALATFALITWSVNELAGAFTVVLCIIASGVLATVAGRQYDLW